MLCVCSETYMIYPETGISIKLIHFGTQAHSPEVPFGNIATSIAIWPCSTRVNARFSSAVGTPKCYVSLAQVSIRAGGSSHPCSGYISSAIQVLPSRVAEVYLRVPVNQIFMEKSPLKPTWSLFITAQSFGSGL